MSLTWFLFLLCLIMGLAAWLVFWWSVRTGQFQEADQAAAEMLELDRLDGTEPSEPSLDELARKRQDPSTRTTTSTRGTP